MRPYKGGEPRAKWVRAPDAIPPSQENTHRRSHYQKIRHKAMSALGEKCSHCGFSDIRALEIDHIKGDGKTDRKKYKGTSYYYFILNDPDPERYQVLCSNCNVIKRAEENECLK